MGYGEDEDLGYLADEDDNNARIMAGHLTEFELMLEYHSLDEHEWSRLSGNEQSRLRWNFRKFGH